MLNKFGPERVVVLLLIAVFFVRVAPADDQPLRIENEDGWQVPRLERIQKGTKPSEVRAVEIEAKRIDVMIYRSLYGNQVPTSYNTFLLFQDQNRLRYKKSSWHQRNFKF